jgi:hypothetical protein
MPLNPADIPLLLIIWRRPHTLRQVIDAIRPLAPTRLFVASDGPRFDRSDEVDKVISARQVIEQEIDWSCHIERRYSDVNQGCSTGPIQAISWFFEHVEEGIILEDDCIPHPDFFTYCATLLERYRGDKRVWCISGNNFQNGQWHGDGSYYFSRYNHCWGWASWRRCWQHYDGDMRLWPAFRDMGLIETIFEDPIERQFWSDTWQRTYEKSVPITWWDYQWTFTCLSNGGLTALPNRNLVSNVGFGSDATHTISASSLQSLDTWSISPILHPSFVVRSKKADAHTGKIVFCPSRPRLYYLYRIAQKARNDLRRFILMLFPH